MGVSGSEKGFWSKVDPKQTFRFFLYGLVFAPVAYRWYSFLDKRFPFKALLNSQKSKYNRDFFGTIGKRVLCDQVVFAPVAVSAFIVVMGTMEGKTKEQIKESHRLRYKKTLIANYYLWPAVQAINLSVIPLIYRVPFGAVFGVVWNSFLSYLTSQEKERLLNSEEEAAQLPVSA
ncbi:Protein SYM1 [Zancudomyces culisetae]|uniref:Protein SYM1 n=1 Tax=Zancudomyces culisetae TaxID=1213189 RepID=A0A1R1PWQ2_ZANCU|nr:Protein SYM1 [Zancudomyces culisetae]|eukprot:OMH85322.1 Protein SYM1 [Zancudomyces culisetae]